MPLGSCGPLAAAVRAVLAVARRRDRNRGRAAVVPTRRVQWPLLLVP